MKGTKEERHWKEVTPEMMSDQERVGEEYVRHPPPFHQMLANSLRSLIYVWLKKE